MLDNLLLRPIGALVGGLLGWELGNRLAEGRTPPEADWWAWGITIAGIIIGVILVSVIIAGPVSWARRSIERTAPSIILATTLGLLIGLALGALLAVPLSMLPGDAGWILPIVISLTMGYTGAGIAMLRGRDLVVAFASFIGNPTAGEMKAKGAQILVDTSAIIDGRIADVSQTGFIQGTLLIPRFILDELRHIADSTDSLRRNRGRRGLDMLNKLQKESDAPIQIVDLDTDDAEDVDSKLVTLAKKLRGSIITTDFNLNRVAELQGIRVLNINELANAVKSVVLPGEEMTVRVIQEGKEVGQGVAFLDDGTMVVVEGGRRHLNNQLDVVVTRVLQTVAGRMIFAHPKQ